MRLLTSTALSSLLLVAAGSAHAQLASGHVADSVVDAQHRALAAHTQMNLCNIHVHKNAACTRVCRRKITLNPCKNSLRSRDEPDCLQANHIFLRYSPPTS